jgi:hypothetical protein
MGANVGNAKMSYPTTPRFLLCAPMRESSGKGRIMKSSHLIRSAVRYFGYDIVRYSDRVKKPLDVSHIEVLEDPAFQASVNASESKLSVSGAILVATTRRVLSTTGATCPTGIWC